MNNPNELDPFETALLTELRREVAEHPATAAPAPRRAPRRRLRVAAAGAVATAAATVVAVGLTGGGPTASPAFAVDSNPDGSVAIVIHAARRRRWSGGRAGRPRRSTPSVEFDADGIGTSRPRRGTSPFATSSAPSPELVPRDRQRARTRAWTPPAVSTNPDPATLEHDGRRLDLEHPGRARRCSSDRHLRHRQHRPRAVACWSWYGGNVAATMRVVGADLTVVHRPRALPVTGSWNSVSCRPAGPSRRALSESHGVRVGGAMSSAPASTSVCVADSASSTSKATRMGGATRRPTSTSSIIAT